MKNTTDKKKSKNLRAALVFIGFLLLLIVFTSRIKIGEDLFGRPWARINSFDTQIKSELGQTRSNAEMYYYDNDGSYGDYDKSEGWKRMVDRIPSCSAHYLRKIMPYAALEYQINISDDGESYVIWAPLCVDDCEEGLKFDPSTFPPFTDQDIKDCIACYCVDSEGSAEEYEGSPTDLEATNCDDLFNK